MSHFTQTATTLPVDLKKLADAQKGSKIVAEISKTWCDTATPPFETIATRFEEVIAINEARGYVLRDWRFSQVIGGKRTFESDQLVETIIAVFEKV